jgi:hypothetical protein
MEMKVDEGNYSKGGKFCEEKIRKMLDIEKNLLDNSGRQKGQLDLNRMRSPIT